MAYKVVFDQIIRRQCAVLSLAALFLLVLTANVYFVYVIVDDKSPYVSTPPNILTIRTEKIGMSTEKRKFDKAEKKKQQKSVVFYRNATLLATLRIEKNLAELPERYHKLTSEHRFILLQLLQDLNSSDELSTTLWDTASKVGHSTLQMSYRQTLWDTASKWVSSREVLPAQAPQLGSVLRTLCSTRIIRAENAQRGTQLKLMLTLAGNQKAIFKPQCKYGTGLPRLYRRSISISLELNATNTTRRMPTARLRFGVGAPCHARAVRYSRTELIDGPVYAGKDRHNAEVAAFHLAVLLGLRRSPLTVGRKINLRREVMPVATDNLLDTFYQEGNNTCFYGVCYYCSPQDPVCAKRDVMEGALIMWLPHGYILKKYRNPWQRTYKTDVLARWEVDQQYCDKVKLSRLYASDQGSRLLDIVDSAIFDFLIDNGDRHHYEVFENFNNSMVLLLDNGKRLRDSTWRRLQLFTGNTLGSSLSSLLEHSHIAPVLLTTHLQALNRRLMLIFAAVEECFSQHNPSQVLVNR
uniref:FAM20 C-terminal domain-containing protein n=1 Tax=Timema genevievae TaxID=629358 RepID=A0A7R9K825_TIMGE|nr:unnamed protein product [Timema genevievae]